MDLIEKLSDAVARSIEDFGKKSSEVIEVNKMRLTISKREREIEELYKKLGLHIYNHMQKYDSITKEEIGIYMEKIFHLQKNIEALEKLVVNILDIKYCPNCKVEFDEEISYCPLCGKYIRD